MIEYDYSGNPLRRMYTHKFIAEDLFDLIEEELAKQGMKKALEKYLDKTITIEDINNRKFNLFELALYDRYIQNNDWFFRWKTNLHGLMKDYLRDDKMTSHNIKTAKSGDRDD